MKYYLLIILLYSTNINADDSSISVLCKKQSLDITEQIKSDVISDISTEQASKIYSVTYAACISHLQQNAATLAKDKSSLSQVENADSDTKDWFTDYLLSGEKADKDGNKRLKRMKR